MNAVLMKARGIGYSEINASILANAYFENDVLDLVNVFIPPLMSSTMNPEAIGRGGGENGDKNKDAKGKDAGKQKMPGEEKQAGRKEKPDDEKSEKTIANKESMN